MLIEPGIQVKAVIHAAPTKLDVGHVELGQQRDPDAQVLGGLFLGQATNGRQRQALFVHHQPREARR